MKKIIKIVLLSTLALAMAFPLCGCEDASEPINTAFVVGIADDETKLNTTGIAEFSALPANPGSTYAFVSAEGDPKCIASGTIPDLDQGYTKTMLNRLYAGIKSDLTEQLSTYTPSSGELNIAAATELAVRNLKANAVEGRQNLLVFYCSGKSTEGVIDMLKTPVYEMDPIASAEAVAKAMKVDMSSIGVVWYCPGDMGGDQPAFSSEEKATMMSFYEQLFYNLGAQSVTFKDDLPCSESYAFPDTPVSCVAVQGTSSGLQSLDPEQLKEALVIPEEHVRFLADSDQFADPEAAANAIQPVADYMVQHPDLSILIYGTCAGDQDTEHTLHLGKGRAERLKNALVEAGVDESRITAVAVKAEDDVYHVYGLGTGSEGSVNRKCVMIDMNSALAQELLANAR